MLHHNTRRKIVRVANGWLGTPFQENAQIKNAGCDCAGLIIGVAKEALNIDIRRDFGFDCAIQAHFSQVLSPQLGDIIIFKNQRTADEIHAAILIDKGRILHAHHNYGVVINSFGRHFQKMVSGFYCFRN